MKKYIVLVFVVLFLFSCWKNDGEMWVIEETWKIMSWYVDTMETSISDAREVSEMLNKRYEGASEIK